MLVAGETFCHDRHGHEVAVLVLREQQYSKLFLYRFERTAELADLIDGSKSKDVDLEKFTIFSYLNSPFAFLLFSSFIQAISY